MQIQIFSIYDKGSNLFGSLFTKVSAVEAVRDFTKMTNDEKTVINEYPKEFDLCKVGEMDTITGKIDPVPPTTIINASSLIKEEKIEK